MLLGVQAGGATPRWISADVQLPTEKPGPVRLAFEADYLDGSRDGSRAVTRYATLEVRTPEEKAALDRKWAEGSAAFFAFSEKLEAPGAGGVPFP